MLRFVIAILAVLAVLAAGGTIGAARAQPAGDEQRGVKVFGAACAACHSLVPGRHLTGPSLAGIWNKRAGTVPGFTRTSPALESSGIVWSGEALHMWLADPKALVPGNWMTFPGLKDAKARADLIAFLETVATGRAEGKGGHPGMMAGPRLQNLKELAPRQRVTAIRHCGDTYRVTTAGGELPPFWEFNLRFKTDSGTTGPRRGRPAILPAGMLGDRASVIFADPLEISAFIEKAC